MFKPTTSKIQKIAEQLPLVIQELEKLLVGKVNVYIDYANIRPWATRLRWHIDLKRLHQFLTDFDTVRNIGFYYGTISGDAKSEQLMQDVKRFGYKVRTKSVKLLKISIDASSINSKSPELLEQFIRGCLLEKLENKTIEYLNTRLQELNKLGIYDLEDRKCNFDVEIGVDMILAHERNEADCFVLWSGDSDFHDPVQELLRAGRKVVLFATARKVASELRELRSEGLAIFDIKKIREFICWNREIGAIKAKGTSRGRP